MSIVANSEVQPSYAFKFPIDCQDRVHLNSQASPAEKTAVTMRQQHVAAGLYYDLNWYFLTKVLTFIWGKQMLRLLIISD